MVLLAWYCLYIVCIFISFQYFDNNEEKMEMSLTNGQIFIHRGRTFLVSLTFLYYNYYYTLSHRTTLSIGKCYVLNQMPTLPNLFVSVILSHHDKNRPICFLEHQVLSESVCYKREKMLLREKTCPFRVNP